jgi:2-polyprenyl-3-methyl-5-hydroxy-6-metoxy-1,4-benzoquinol methylase
VTREWNPDGASLRAERDALIARDGPWTGPPIPLPDGITTHNGAALGDERLRRIVQVVADLTAKPLEELRVLDLACFEGQYAIEFALQGAEAVGIEGREANLAKARFSAEAHGLDQLSLVHGDVRDLRREQFGGFDVVLCLGLLYHLDFPEAIRFLERVAEVCDFLAIFDTHVNLGWSRAVRDGANIYRGRPYIEHSSRAAASEREQSRWASLDNPRSFWFTRASLMNAFVDVGFTSAYECEVPPDAAKPADRRMFIAIKGSRAALRTAPGYDRQEWARVPERRSRARLLRNHAPGTNLIKRLLLDLRALYDRRTSRGFGPQSYGRRR